MCHWGSPIYHDIRGWQLRRKAAGSRPSLCPSACVTTLHGIPIAVWSEATTFCWSRRNGTCTALYQARVRLPGGVFESAESSKLKITGERIFTKKTEDGTGKSDSDKPRRATYETFQKLIGNIHSTSPRTERSFVLRELRSLV